MNDHALLLVNLGSPASFEKNDVRRYLNQFLMDPFVIDLPWALRRVLVSLILMKRSKETARAYSSIWWEGGSPLIVLTKRLQAQMSQEWSAGPVELAMRYGNPSIESMIIRLAIQGITKITLVPLYPQFADSTVTTVVEEAKRVVREQMLSIDFSIVQPFYDEPEYLGALTDSIRPHLHKPYDHFLFSYHGLPQSHIDKLDESCEHHFNEKGECCEDLNQEMLAKCYRSQCFKTSATIAHRLGIPEGKWSVSFQSRLGRAKWIQPYTDVHLSELAEKGVKRLSVVCPAFVADCIETLEEIGDRGTKLFQKSGGEELSLIPCLNDNPTWAYALNKMCLRASEFR